LAAGLLLAISIPIVGNYFMKDRMKAVSRDLQMREEHWSGTVAMRADGWQESLFGAGLGSYPERHFWDHRSGEFPGVLTYQTEADRRFVRLGGPRTAGSGEALRLSQRIDLARGQRLQLTLDLRSATAKSGISV